MAQSSYPFDEQSVTEDQWSAMMTTLAETHPVTGLVPYGDSSGRQVKVPSGTAWVRGHFYVSTATETLAIGANASGNPRIDTVVLELDPTANSIELAVVAGTAAASPAPPTLTQTDTGVWQHPLANVAVANGAATIAATDVQLRAWTSETRPPGHNLLHNGAMQVHQRGTSTAGITATGYYTADRWHFHPNSLGTWTQSVESDAPTGSGFRKSFKALCTTADASPAADDYCQVYQAIEGQNLQSIKKGTASAEQLTVSFWVKSNKTGVYVVRLNDIDNTRNVSATYTVDASATWEQKSITFPADATGAFDNNADASLYLLFYLAAGSNRTSGTLATTWEANNAADMAVGQTNLAADTNNYWMITGVQLEVGSAATGFEHKDYGTELAECQRYYQKSYNTDVTPGTSTLVGLESVVWDGASDANYIGINVTYSVTMRTTPTTVSIYAPDGTAGEMGTSLDTPNHSAGASSLRASGARGFLVFNASPAATPILACHYAASADL